MIAAEIAGWLRAFALTASIEVPIAAWLFARAEPSVRRRLGVAFLANLVSHPVVWFVLPRIFVSYPRMVVAAESWAVASEAIFYALVFPNAGPSRAFGVSALANGASLGVGLLLRALTGWV